MCMGVLVEYFSFVSLGTEENGKKINSLWDVMDTLAFEILYYEKFPDSGVSIPFGNLLGSINLICSMASIKEQTEWTIQFYFHFYTT